MIFALFCLHCLSCVLGTVTNIHDIENIINSYLSHTMDEHALHATSYDYMQIVQDELPWKMRYFQSVRYIEFGFSMYRNSSSQMNSTNDKVHKKLNFIQSIAYFYCGINMSSVMGTSFDNIHINKSQLYMNSQIFPVQLVESYKLVQSEICERIKLGLYQSVVAMFKPDTNLKSNQRNNLPLNRYPDVNADSCFPHFVGTVAKFISFKTRASFSVQTMDEMYPFLAKFGEFESYKETVIRLIWQMDNSVALQSIMFGNTYTREIYANIDTFVHQIKHPKMNKYVTNILKQQVNSTGNKSFILDHDKTEDDLSRKFWRYVQIYRFLTHRVAANHGVGNKTVEVYNMFQLLHKCQKYYMHAGKTGLNTMIDCALITFGIYESCEGDIDGHEYVLNAIKCIISNHRFYCSNFDELANVTETKTEYSSMFLTLTNDLRQSLNEAVFYPYVNELFNDDHFIHIVNTNTDSEIDTYLQTILIKLMVVALEEYKDIEMIKQIATVFKQKINFCANCVPERDDERNSSMISWMDLLMKQEYMYLTKYFQHIFSDHANCFR